MSVYTVIECSNVGNNIGMTTQGKAILYAGQEKTVGQLESKFYVPVVEMRRGE